MTTSVLNSSFFATGTEPATAGFSEITAASPSSVDGFAAVFEATTAVSVTTDLTAPTINPATTPILSPVAFTSAPLEATEFSFAPLMTEDASDAGSSSPSPLLPDSMGGDAMTSPVVSAPKSVTSVELAASTAPAEIHEETPAVIPVTRESPRISNKKAVREETSSDDVSEDVADDTSPPESTESGLPSPLLQSVAPAFLPVPQIPIVLSIPIEVQPNAVVEGNETDTSVSTSALEAADDTTPRSNLGYSSERESPEAATYASLATSAESIPSSKKEKLSSAVSPREGIAPTRSAVDGTVKAVAGQPLATGVEPAPADRTARQPAQETMPVSASFETPVETVSQLLRPFGARRDGDARGDGGDEAHTGRADRGRRPLHVG